MDGDDVAFEEFVRTRSAALLRSGYVLTGNPHDAPDLVQEALARARFGLVAGAAQGPPRGLSRQSPGRVNAAPGLPTTARVLTG